MQCVRDVTRRAPCFTDLCDVGPCVTSFIQQVLAQQPHTWIHLSPEICNDLWPREWRVDFRKPLISLVLSSFCIFQCMFIHNIAKYYQIRQMYNICPRYIQFPLKIREFAAVLYCGNVMRPGCMDFPQLCKLEHLFPLFYPILRAQLIIKFIWTKSREDVLSYIKSLPDHRTAP